MIAFYWFVESFRRSNFVMQYFKGEEALWYTPIILFGQIDRFIALAVSFVMCELTNRDTHFPPLNSVTYLKNCSSQYPHAYSVSVVIRIPRKSVSILLDKWRLSAIFTMCSQEEVRGKEKSSPSFRGKAETRQAPRGNGVTFIWSPEQEGDIFPRGKLSNADGDCFLP